VTAGEDQSSRRDARIGQDGSSLSGTDLERLDAFVEHELERGGGRLLGRGYQAAVYLLDSPVGPVVVKKAHASPFLHRIGLRALRREAAVYERLREVSGVPRSYGLVDDHLVLEHIAGPSLRLQEKLLADRERFFARLLETLDAMHTAGVAHGDLKRKDNVLVGPGEQPYVIDFGIAWCIEPGSPRWRRRIFAVLCQMDYNSWLKLKYRRRFEDAEHVARADAERYRPLLLERAARAIRIPWQKVTLRRFRKRRRKGST
jgi:predicted Ser/Thr protein kinase